MTYEEKRQWASDVLEDMVFAIHQKKRLHKRYVRHGAVKAAAALAIEIDGMEIELQCEQELFDLAFN
jgi:hypothetical protein